MRHNPRLTGVIGTALAAVVSVGAAWAIRPRSAPVPDPAAMDPGPAQVAFVQGSDLDGDGRADGVQWTETGLLVTDGSGSTLLRYEGPIVSKPITARPGGDTPVLFAETAKGEYAAFAFNPGKGVLQAMVWPDGRMRGYGELSADGSLKETMVGSTVRVRSVELRADRLRLIAGRIRYEPRTTPGSTPSEALTAAIEAAALDLASEMALHFEKPESGEAFLSAWKGKLPVGTVRVAHADEVNAGGEFGHVVPVSVWIAGATEVAGLRGEASFTPASGGFRVRALRLDLLPLKIRSYQQATQLVADPEPVKPADVPFYGQFRLTAGERRYSVDALTGRVERE